MSHFTVLVLMRKDQIIGDLLAPYDENKEVPPYISTPRDEFIADKRKWYSREKGDEEENDEPDYSVMSDEDFLKAMAEKGYDLDEQGNETSTYNPKSQWDWWAVGGRWNNSLRLKVPDEDGNDRCNYALVKDLNFDPDPEVYKKRERFWELYIEGAEPANAEEKEMLSWTMRTKEYFIDRFGTKENYATLESQFETWAVVTPDGEWHEKGNMGWWGMSDETHEEAVQWVNAYKEKFIDTADPEWVAVVVDCHI